MYDVGIIGAGPAGATLARLLAERFQVLLIDDGRRKCCGGILSPEAQRMLAQLDLAIPKKVLVNPQPFSVAVLDTATKLVKHYPRQYININRAAFDGWLRSLVPAAVDVRSQCRFESVNIFDNLCRINFADKQGKKYSEEVRLLVGADGANSAVRRSCFATSLPEEYIAVQDWYAADEIEISNPQIDFWNDYTGIFDSELTDFYAWTIPKDDVLLFGAALPLRVPVDENSLLNTRPLRKNCRQKFDEFKAKLADFGLQLGKPFRKEAGVMFRPLLNNSIFLGTEYFGSIALIGEAAGLISPSSAEGISFALASALALSESFRADGTFSIRLYRRNCRSLQWKIWRRKFKIPIMFNPLLRKWIMNSGLTALNRQ